jgi:hypothetical protein
VSDQVSDYVFDVAGFLESRQERILASAEAAVGSRGLLHYGEHEPETKERLRALMHVVIDSCRERRLDAALEYASQLAHVRRSGGVPLAEVQTTINVLEEAIWRTITTDAELVDQTDGLGMVATVLGAIKDRVACGYLEQVTHHRVKSLRVDLLFEGTDAHIPHQE